MTPDWRSSRTSRWRTTEVGTVLPLVALTILVLMMFAALAVDLGAAWAERRQDQTAADAAAMAGAIEYVRSNPTEAEIVAIVQDYVERNIGFPANDPGWATCAAPTDGFQALAGNNCVSLKQASTTASDTLLKVRVPDQFVATSFARVIGINSITVSAEAIARIEQNEGLQGALPFVLPSDSGDEYCLGTPPGGQARELCQGPSNGFFGTVDSPYFGAADDPWGTTSCLDSPTNLNTRIVWNTALGIDHFLRIAPDSAVPADGADVCAATQDPAYVPYAIVADQGSITQASDGFIGPGPYGSLGREGRLRQSGGDPALTRKVPSGSGTIELDDVGLWNYLVEPTSPSDPCRKSEFDEVSGTALTAQLMVCLSFGNPLFSDALLDSPRFALVPMIDLAQAELGALGPNSKAAANILRFVPVYIQASWYNCSATQCMFFDPDENPPPTTRPEVFEPGEGTQVGCLLQGNGCKKNVNLVLEGVTALLLDDEKWLPDAFDNQFNEPGAFNVFLFR